MLASPRTASRRVVLAGGGAALLTGCDLDPRAEPEPAPAPTSGVPSAVSPDADVELLDDMRFAVRVARAHVALVRSEYPGLRRALAPLSRLHVAHLRVLANAGEHGDDQGFSPDPVQPGDAQAALRQLAEDERSLQRRLARASLEAASGPFARMLASMSAGVAAHLAALPEVS